MDTSSTINNSVLLTQGEIIWLMWFMGAEALLGGNINGNQDIKVPTQRATDQEKVVNSLIAKQILINEKKEQFELSPNARPLLETLYFPERAMMMTRNRSGFGRQIFYVLRKGASIVMHSFPQEEQHFVALISQPSDLVQILVDWFPLYPFPISSTSFLINKPLFDHLRSLVENGEEEQALEAFDIKSVESTEKKNFLNAIAHRTFSGAIGWVFIRSNTVEKADSVFLLSDGRTAWLVSQVESLSPKEIIFSVRRTGADFVVIIRNMVERLVAAKLSKQQAVPSGKFIRFVLDLDELALGLASINCVDLSQKIMGAVSRELTAHEYQDHLHAGQQSLVDHGLCTLSPQGLPVLPPELAQAVFAIAESDSMIDITIARGGLPAGTGIYIIRGRCFTTYYNYGSQLQLLEYGKFADLTSYLEFLFPEFGSEKSFEKKTFSINYEAIELALGKIRDRGEAKRILRSDGLSDSNAEFLVNDLSDSSFRATLVRRGAPSPNNNMQTEPDATQPAALLLLKSPRRSWIFQFQETGVKGTAEVTNREGFIKALSVLIA